MAGRLQLPAPRKYVGGGNEAAKGARGGGPHPWGQRDHAGPGRRQRGVRAGGPGPAAVVPRFPGPGYGAGGKPPRNQQGPGGGAGELRVHPL